MRGKARSCVRVYLSSSVASGTLFIEPPELVSQRICNFAPHVGRENVIADADCGFGGRSHPQFAWAKLKSLTEEAALASRALS